MSRLRHLRLLPLIAATALVAAAPPAWARAQMEQDEAPQSRPAPGVPDMPVAPIAPAELERFVEAAERVREIDATARSELATTPSEDQAQTLRERADREMRWAIEQEGLTVSRYQEIYVVVQSDPALAEEVILRMQ